MPVRSRSLPPTALPAARLLTSVTCVPPPLSTSPRTILVLQVRLALELMFEGTQGTGDLAQVTGTTGEILRIGTAVTLTYQAKTEQQPRPCVILEWEGGPMNDMIADAVIAVILQVRSHSPWGPMCETAVWLPVPLK